MPDPGPGAAQAPGNHLFQWGTANGENFHVINISLIRHLRHMRHLRHKFGKWRNWGGAEVQELQASPSKAATSRENCTCRKQKAPMVFLWALGDHTLFDSPGSIPLNRPDFRRYRRRSPAAAPRGDAGQFSGAMPRQVRSFLLQDSVPHHFEHRRGAQVPRWPLPP